MSGAALLTVLIGGVLPVVMTGRIPPPQPDEGTAAHIFQLSLAALLPIGLVFLATADWTLPTRNVRRLVGPAVMVAAALGTLFWLESSQAVLR